MHWPLALVQLFFTLGWTVYVIFLPGLLKLAGIDVAWLPWILIVDQLLFAMADFATGVWLDRSERLFHSAGNWLTALVLLGCAIFMLLPFAAHSMPAWLFLPALFVWVICSSVLRVPPLVLLAKYATPGQAGGLTSPVATYLFGLGVAGAVAPYLTVILKNLDPLLPFMLASVALALTTLMLRPHFGRSVPLLCSAPTTIRTSGFALPLLIAFALFAFGMQIHAAVNSAKLYARVAPGIPMEWLMPLFWAGFSVAMFPVSAWLARDAVRDGSVSRAVARALWLGGLTGGFAFIACTTVPPLPLLVVLQIVAGTAWATVFLAAIAAASQLGRTGREGSLIGTTLALLALATAGRIVLVLLLAPANSTFFGGMIATQLTWLSGVAWLLGAALLVTTLSWHARP